MTRYAYFVNLVRIRRMLQTLQGHNSTRYLKHLSNPDSVIALISFDQRFFIAVSHEDPLLLSLFQSTSIFYLFAQHNRIIQSPTHTHHYCFLHLSLSHLDSLVSSYSCPIPLELQVGLVPPSIAVALRSIALR